MACEPLWLRLQTRLDMRFAPWASDWVPSCLLPLYARTAGLMQWIPAPSKVDDGQEGDRKLHRFGHSCSIVDASATWGCELAVCFGGVQQSADSSGPAGDQHAATGDVLVLTGDGLSWFAPQIHGPKPSPRAFHAAAVVNANIFIWGGHVLNFEEDGARRKRTFFNDLWILDTESWRWQVVQVNGTEVPGRRDMASLIALGTDALLLFGGRNESGRTLSDTWLYDIAQRQWHQLRAGGAHPAPRKMHAAAYVNGRMLVFGGERDNGVLDDLWSLKIPVAPLAAWLPQHLAQQATQAQGTLLVQAAGQGDELCRWTQIRVRPSPPARFGHSLSVCGGGRLLLLFGGCLDQAGFLALTHSFVQCDETWVLDMASFSWQRETPAGHNPAPGQTLPSSGSAGALAAAAGGGGSHGLAGPSERMCHTMSALADGRLLLLGGRRKEGICKDGWWLHLEPPRPLTGPQAQPTGATQDAATKSPPAPIMSTTGPALLKSLFNPAAAKASGTPPTSSPTPTWPQGSSPLQGSSTNLAQAGDTPPAAATGSMQTTPRQSNTGNTGTGVATPTSASSAMSKLAGLLGSRPAAAAGGPPGAEGLPPAVGESQASGSGSWLSNMPDSAGQLFDKLKARVVEAQASLPWQQQQQQEQQPAAAAGQLVQQPWQQYQQQHQHQQHPYYQQQQPWSTTYGPPAGTGAAPPMAAQGGLGTQATGRHREGEVPGLVGAASSGYASLDHAAVMALHAAADAAEFERFRETVLHLPPTPVTSTLPVRPSPTPSFSNAASGVPASRSGSAHSQHASDPAQAHAALRQRGQQLLRGQPGGARQDPENFARSHLSLLPPDEITLQDLQLILQDYPVLLQRASVPFASPTSSDPTPPHTQASVTQQKFTGSSQNGTVGLVAGLLGQLHASQTLSTAHLVLGDNGSMLRVGDVPALLEDYRHLCASVS